MLPMLHMHLHIYTIGILSLSGSYPEAQAGVQKLLAEALQISFIV